MIGLFLACGALIASSLVVGTSRGGSPVVSCKAYGLVSTRAVDHGGRVYSIGSASEQKEYERGCAHYRGPVIFPDCDAWESNGLIDPRRLAPVEPFYTDGTCDGSGGGARLADAPVEIIDSTPWPPGPAR
jgi:hypothetical protein